MPRRQALVAEVAVDLVDLLETADDQALEIQFGRHAQEQAHVERVVMGHERTRRGAARDHLHHRRFDLEEPAFIEEATDITDNGGAGPKGIARHLAHNKVEVTLAVLGFGVRQAVIFLGQRPQRLRQQADVVHLDRELPGLGLEQRSFGAEDVADVPFLEVLVARLAHGVARDIDLDQSRHVLQVRKAGLAHDPAGHHPPRHLDPHMAGLDLGRVLLAVLGMQLAGHDVAAEVIRESDTLLP